MGVALSTRTTRSATIRAKTTGSCFLRRRRQEGTCQQCSSVSTTTRRPAEVLREGSGIKVETTAGDGLTISRYNKDAGNPPYSSGLPGLIYHQRAQSSEFLLRAVTGTSFWPHGRMPI